MDALTRFFERPAPNNTYAWGDEMLREHVHPRGGPCPEWTHPVFDPVSDRKRDLGNLLVRRRLLQRAERCVHHMTPPERFWLAEVIQTVLDDYRHLIAQDQAETDACERGKNAIAVSSHREAWRAKVYNLDLDEIDCRERDGKIDHAIEMLNQGADLEPILSSIGRLDGLRARLQPDWETEASVRTSAIAILKDWKADNEAVRAQVAVAASRLRARIAEVEERDGKRFRMFAGRWVPSGEVMWPSLKEELKKVERQMDMTCEAILLRGPYEEQGRPVRAVMGA